MANATLTLTGAVSSLPTGSKTIALPGIAISTAVGQITDLNLSSGDNVITVAPGASFAIILPPAGNPVLLKIKGAGGDTGIAIHKTFWSVLALDSSVTSFIINAATTVNGIEISFV